MKECKHCHKKFSSATAAHYCPEANRDVDHEDDLDFLAAIIVACDFPSNPEADCGIVSDADTSSFGGDGGDFGGGGSSSDF